jgi:hypothetical protein
MLVEQDYAKHGRDGAFSYVESRFYFWLFIVYSFYILFTVPLFVFVSGVRRLRGFGGFWDGIA